MDKYQVLCGPSSILRHILDKLGIDTILIVNKSRDINMLMFANY